MTCWTDATQPAAYSFDPAKEERVALLSVGFRYELTQVPDRLELFR